MSQIISFWEQVSSDELAQGDLLRNCSVPIVSADFATAATELSPFSFRAEEFDLIVMTQSCDLANNRAPLVACCPTHSLRRFEEFSPKFKKSGAWESVRQGRQEGLHLLSSTTKPEDNTDALVVDFRSIYSLPVDYLRRHAAKLGPRSRLRSPFLEHFSQAFARFFMRVGLPSSIPPFK
jgi:hypothetical protein